MTVRARLSRMNRIRDEGSEVRDQMDETVVQVVGPTDNWVLERIARVLAAKLPYATFSEWEPKRSAPPGIAYYVNYAL